MHIIDGIFTAIFVLMGLFILLIITAWWKDGHR